ncbi:hypothetical protein [Fibrobacter sp. HC4]|uniref:hypothetical protein n=1 Tax=Fibrobacter sp. HC4 TaxID=3239812 RepID=UPI002018AF49|nr:hypothetical protein [Fibrobacter succinogenes]MCL4102065.1 hypothetical protein [Fibrobacter succinogenes]
MKKKFGLACATLVAMSLMACSEDSTNTIQTPKVCWPPAPPSVKNWVAIRP